MAAVHLEHTLWAQKEEEEEVTQVFQMQLLVIQFTFKMLHIRFKFPYYSR